jgi:hypothetical protein
VQQWCSAARCHMLHDVAVPHPGILPVLSSASRCWSNKLYCLHSHAFFGKDTGHLLG